MGSSSWVAKFWAADDFAKEKQEMTINAAAGELAMDASTSRYHEVYARWRRDPLGFWGEAAREIDRYEAPKTVFDPKAGVYGRWFPDGVVNTCWNAVDRHVPPGYAGPPGLDH